MQRQLSMLPASPATVAEHVAHLAETRRPTTISRRLASISVAHKAAGFTSPCSSELVRSTLAGVRRRIGTAKRRVVPIRVRHIRASAEAMRTDLKGLRGRALLLIAYAACLRRSELVALDVEDVRLTDLGAELTIRKSKTDQFGEGHVIAIHRGERETTCPVRALQTWLDAAGIRTGPVFRPVAKGGRVSENRLSSQAVAEVIKSLAPLMGLDPRAVAGHSTRSGMITDAFAVSGLTQAEIARHSRHRSNVIADYLREADLYSRNPSGKVGL